MSSVDMKIKLLGLVSSLVLFASAHAHATTIYDFDTMVSGTTLPVGTVSLNVVGSTATFTVSFPTNYTFSEFALDLVSGGTVNPSSAYSVTSYSPGINVTQGKTFGYIGPFNTVLSGNFGNSLTFIVSNYTGIFDISFTDKNNIVDPIWFVAGFVNHGSTTGFIAADSIEPVVTPLPGALPLFAGGLSVLGLLVRRRNRAGAAPLSTA